MSLFIAAQYRHHCVQFLEPVFAVQIVRLDILMKFFADLDHIVKRHLFSPGNGADTSRLERDDSKRGAHTLLTGLGVSRINLGTQLEWPLNPC